MRYFLILLSAIVLTSGCTFSVNMVENEGEAKDVVEETTENSPNVVPTITLPPDMV